MLPGLGAGLLAARRTSNLSVTVGDTNWVGSGPFSATCTATIGLTGDGPPYTYLWAVDSGDAVLVSGQGTANASFTSATGATAVVSCTATDSGGTEAIGQGTISL